MNTAEIKICGLTIPDQAVACAQAGADAIGLVFYEPSPRNVSPVTAKEITRAAGGLAKMVGVFVNEDVDTIIRIAETASLDYIQLHGTESLDDLKRISDAGLKTIKVITNTDQAEMYSQIPLLFEPKTGELPGGNGSPWRWETARPLSKHRTLILAGGLTPHNVKDAITQGDPDAVDVSSGVESAKGIKDIALVKEFITAVKSIEIQHELRKVFK